MADYNFGRGGNEGIEGRRTRTSVSRSATASDRLDIICESLRNSRRRHLLDYLVTADGEVFELADAVTAVCERETAGTETETEMETESETEAGMETKTEEETGTESVTEAETESEAGIEMETEAETETATKMKTKTANQPSREAVRTALHHNHLPRLADADVLDYDTRQGTIRFTGHGGIEEWLEYARSKEME